MASIQGFKISGIAPVREIEAETGPRLNLFCGDNGAGKSLILDALWSIALPNEQSLLGNPLFNEAFPKPRIALSSLIEGNVSKKSYEYEFSGQYWATQYLIPDPGPTFELALYLRPDTDAVFFDGLRGPLPRPRSDNNFVSIEDHFRYPKALYLSNSQIWNGRQEEDTQFRVINGLIEDLAGWYFDPDEQRKNTFIKVLKKLSPPESNDLGEISLGKPRRLLTTDARNYPVLHFSFGDVPITQASSGIRRIVSLAYLIVWLWYTHKENAALSGKSPANNFTIFVDEIEAHLHPQWQRKILPALLEVGKCLADDVNIQFFITTHSPLVLASLEPHFDETRDKLFHLDLVRRKATGNEVELKEIPFFKRGSADDWLTDETFGLKSARSIEAEKAIAEAEKLLSQTSPNKEKVKKAHQKLVAALPDIDEFWPRWLYFAREHGAVK